MDELLIRALYCEMLGHPAPFAHIHAVELTQKKKLRQKRIGYLCAAVFLHENHELNILMINSFIRDLNESTSTVLEICAALNGMSWLISEETVPTISDTVIKKLNHSSEMVRKKAIVVLNRCLKLKPSLISSCLDHLVQCLCYTDPTVMGSTMHCFITLMKSETFKEDSPTLYAGLKKLVPTLVSILKQLVDKKPSRDFEYHRICAPWMQTTLLRLLRYLGTDDKAASESMFAMLSDILTKTDVKTTLSGNGKLPSTNQVQLTFVSRGTRMYFDSLRNISTKITLGRSGQL